MILDLNFSGRTPLGNESSLKHDRVPKQEIQLGELRQSLYGSGSVSTSENVEEQKQTCGVQLRRLVELGDSLDEIH
jgi:hypothetical protein